DHFVTITTVDQARYDQVAPVIYPLPGTRFRDTFIRGGATPEFAAHVLGRGGEAAAERRGRGGSRGAAGRAERCIPGRRRGGADRAGGRVREAARRWAVGRDPGRRR